MENKQKAADNDPEEFVETLKVWFSIFDQAVGVNDWNGSEEQDEGEVGDIGVTERVLREEKLIALDRQRVTLIY